MIPESPRYLVAQNREPEAANVLSKVLGGDVRAKIEEIRQTVLREDEGILLVPKAGEILYRVK